MKNKILTPFFARKRADMPLMFDPSRYAQPYFLFYQVNHIIPRKISIREVDRDKLYEALMTKYNIDPEDTIESKNYTPESKKHSFCSVIIPIKKNVWIYFSHGGDGYPSVEILFTPKTDPKLIDEVRDLIASFYNYQPVKSKLYLLQHTEYEGCTLKCCQIQDVAIDFNLHYNDDFAPVHNIITQGLQKDNAKGLVLLHGLPGTGKTSYIRYLTSVVKKQMIYLPPDMAHEITSPRFISLISDYPNSVLVIEDAENVIEERKTGTNSAMSNLLNLSDGLLADCLRMQIICTFNTDISRIDKALLRKGRLLAKYDFKALSVEKAQHLSDNLGYKNEISREMTLAEIFNQEERGFNEEVRKIGFVKNY